MADIVRRPAVIAAHGTRWKEEDFKCCEYDRVVKCRVVVTEVTR